MPPPPESSEAGERFWPLARPSSSATLATQRRGLTPVEQMERTIKRQEAELRQLRETATGPRAFYLHLKHVIPEDARQSGPEAVCEQGIRWDLSWVPGVDPETAEVSYVEDPQWRIDYDAGVDVGDEPPLVPILRCMAADPAGDVSDPRTLLQNIDRVKMGEAKFRQFKTHLRALRIALEMIVNRIEAIADRAPNQVSAHDLNTLAAEAREIREILGT